MVIDDLSVVGSGRVGRYDLTCQLTRLLLYLVHFYFCYYGLSDGLRAPTAAGFLVPSNLAWYFPQQDMRAYQ
jgi:hypothetical protein